jgi:hypothetical protein
MYVSPAVRTIRDDPIEGEPVELLVEAADGTDLASLAERLESAGATVEAELEFETLRVSIGQEEVGAVCDCAGIASVETANTLGIDPTGAGEDF